MEFIPGTILHQIPSSNVLFYQAGEYIAKLDLILKVSIPDTSYDNNNQNQ